MKIIINENKDLDETEIVINCSEVNDEILRIVASLKQKENVITGNKNGRVYIIKIDEVLYFESVDKRTFIYTESEVYETHLRLYEIEQRFSTLHFFRASKSTIINIPKISFINTMFGGRMEVILENKEKLIVSRQYVPILKEKLDY